MSVGLLLSICLARRPALNSSERARWGLREWLISACPCCQCCRVSFAGARFDHSAASVPEVLCESQALLASVAFALCCW